MPAIRRILCPTDFSPTSLRAIEWAAELAKRLNTEIVLAHAFDMPAAPTKTGHTHPADPSVSMQLEQVTVPAPDIQVRRRLHAGIPGEVICWLAQEEACDLIVMGTHGRTGLVHLLFGSVAEHVLRHARCPVMTVRDRAASEPPLKEPLAIPLPAPRYM